MRKLLFIVIALAICMIAVSCRATPTLLRLLFQTHTPPDSNGLGLACRLISPNLVNPVPTNIVDAGPRWSSKTNWFEALGGVRVSNQKTSPLVNVRGMSTKYPFHGYAEIQYFPGDKQLYWDTQIVYPIKIKALLIKTGVEAEGNYEHQKKTIVRLGLYVNLPFSETMTMAVSRFIDNNSGNITRIYAMFNFKK